MEVLVNLAEGMMTIANNDRLKMKHGDKLDCPTCGAPGFLDIDTPSGEKLPDDKISVWFNNKLKHWECTDCMWK